MAKELILAKYGEMALKGLNRGTFEDILMKNLRRRLKKFGAFKLNRAQSTIYMEPLSEDIDLDEVLEHLQCVFGIAALCRACVCEKTMEDISAKAVPYLEEVLLGAKTFKVEAKRADKAFPLKSPEICAELGGILLDAYPHLSVDVRHPDVTVMVEIRDTHAFVHGANLKGAGGLPVGSSGNALLLLSGGIDSPVAGYRMARRGVHISAIHYVSPPYTSDRAQEKVEQLCQELTPYCGNIAFFCVPFTEIQEAIKKYCPEEYFTVIMRRLMMEIAQKIAAKDNCLALITGESVGQVASQTMQGIQVINAVCDLPVLRPLAGMDKAEIIERAEKIGTFEISIRPYEDCCTVFVAKHPVTKPRLNYIEKAEHKLTELDRLLEEAVANAEIIDL